MGEDAPVYEKILSQTLQVTRDTANKKVNMIFLIFDIPIKKLII